MIRALVAISLAIGLAACAAPDSGAGRDTRGGKVALPEAPPPPTVADDPIMCTMDARQCPDGSYVSRNPAKGCAFNACPGTAPR